ncbi:hypothetical protein [Roseateles albus]|uniref:SPOR domain-containing protein n=1 Tax=Roseateles albus TaxID=2987525 RepID=A0ABT5KIL6_9BURK|nr:hypothetical protein [Roseateles albus]MDC8772785.1 hypothetical protein [Roseateles albus]
MDRLAEQVVAWHNRHPLAKRITIYDVHTIGVVALPFMRNAQADAAARGRGAKGKVEPVLTDEISPESLAAAWDEEGLTIAVDPNAAHLDALADQEPPPKQGQPSWRERLSRFAFWRKPSATEAKSWPVFSERFVSHLSPKRIAAFAQAHGYTSQPGDASWPQRIIPIDETLMDSGGKAGSKGGGAWPFELYVMSAAIDAGRSRSRILLGRGRQPAITGRRCLSPRRLALVALLLLALLGAGAGLLLPSAKKAAPALGPDPAASAAATTASAAASPPAPLPAPEQASAPPQAASEAASSTAPAGLPLTPLNATSVDGSGAAASAAASAAVTGSAAAPQEAASPEEPSMLKPDIRPMFIKPIPGRTAPPLGAPPKQVQLAEPDEAKKEDKKPEDKKAAADLKAQPEPAQEEPPKPKAKSALAHVHKPKLSSESSETAAPNGSAATPAATTPAGKTETATTAPPSGKAIAKAAALANKPVVALVGPISANKADAEATLARMRAMLSPQQGGAGGTTLQAQVFQTPEGWRPAVWPFASREEAQLINATLIARGMRTRAVDF